jgi:hypothetical protein
MYCPICKAEYRPGFTVCSDCDVQLVSELPEDPPEDETNELPTVGDLYSPNNEVELALIKSILDAEGINYFVKNDLFGSMEVGPRIELLNKKMIMVQSDQYERALELIKDYLSRTQKEAEEEKYSLFDKIRMIVEFLLFRWMIPGKKKKRNNEP